MKRGIIRIVAGSILLFIQILGLLGQSSISYSYSANYNIGYYIGLYSTGIAGILLLIFGVRAYRAGIHSQLILHRKGKALDTVVKYAACSITALLFLYHLWSFVRSWHDFSISTILMICGTLSLAVYLLFYLAEKPSCLFSASLIFIGAAYLFELFSHATDYLWLLIEIGNGALYAIFGVIPTLLAGILYIVIAISLYKEKFSIQYIKTLGWIAFALEFSSRVLCQILVFRSFDFGNWAVLLSDLLPVVLLLYISVLQINTLKEPSIS